MIPVLCEIYVGLVVAGALFAVFAPLFVAELPEYEARPDAPLPLINVEVNCSKCERPFVTHLHSVGHERLCAACRAPCTPVC